MTENIYNLLLLFVFGFLPLSLVLYFHPKTFFRHIKIIIKLNLFSLSLWFIGGSLSYQEKIWTVTYHSFLNIKVLGILFGDILQSLIGTTIISLVTILLYEAYEKKKRFRDILLQKEK